MTDDRPDRPGDFTSEVSDDPPPVPTVADESNALRFNLYQQSQRVEAYRSERGRLGGSMARYTLGASYTFVIDRM